MSQIIGILSQTIESHCIYKISNAFYLYLSRLGTWLCGISQAVMVGVVLVERGVSSRLRGGEG